MCYRKWDWSTITLIMPGTTALTWLSHIAVGLPYFQSSSPGVKGRGSLLLEILLTLLEFYNPKPRSVENACDDQCRVVNWKKILVVKNH